VGERGKKENLFHPLPHSPTLPISLSGVINMQKRKTIASIIAILLLLLTVGYVFGQRWGDRGGQGGRGGDIPPFIKEILDQEGISPEELQNNPELRQKVMEKVRQMRANPEFRQGMQNRMGEFRGPQPSLGERFEAEKDSQNPVSPKRFEFQMGRAGKSDLPEKYRLISENNLFRPLGYEGQRMEVGYRLVGLVNNSNEVKALIVESNGNSHYVKVGDRIGNAVVDKVLERQVVLIRDGKPIELRLEEMQFMSSSALSASASGDGKGQPGPPGGGSGGPLGGMGSGGGPSGGGMLSEEEMKKMRQEAEEKMRAEMRERRLGEGGGGGGRRGQERLEFRGGGPGRGEVIIRRSD
jgi:hypothetical protein